MKKLFAGKKKIFTIPLFIILSFCFLPFIIGGIIAYFIYKKINNKLLKYTGLTIVILFTLFFGVAWILALNSSKNQTTKSSAPQSPEIAKVVRVIDGDTIEVSINNNIERVRIIGINTPETVDPRKSVECFGREASKKAKEYLEGKTVELEADPTQGNRDKYGRLLRYVWLNNRTVDFGKLMILTGYAYEYTYNLPYKYQSEYKQAQKEAEAAKLGLWADGVCVITPTPMSTKTTTQSSTSQSTSQRSCKYPCESLP